MRIRVATATDADLIARLHVESWRSAYGELLDPVFLAGPLEKDRHTAWTSRFSQVRPCEQVVIAETGNEPIGFACAVGAEDGRWGTLVDNLHVLPSTKGRGVGTALLGAVAEWSLAACPGAGLYLWCFEGNGPSRRFYERRGGVVVERIMDHAPGGGVLPSLRFHWSDPASLLRFPKVR